MSRLTNVAKKVAYPVGVAFVLLVIAYHFVGYYQIPQNGMYPGLPAGSRLFALRKPYADSWRVSRGDIVVFNHTIKGAEYKFIWRVVGLPGDTVETSADGVAVNGRKLTQEETRREGPAGIFRETNGDASYEVAYDTPPPAKPPLDTKLVVPEGQFFVMGDNRHNAIDSRYFGPITFESIVGKKW